MWYERGAKRVLAATLLLIGCSAAAGSAEAAGKQVTPIADITTEYAGKVATVRGMLTSERAFKAGVRYVVQDDSGEITLVLFERAQRGAPKLTVGATVQATGKVDFYKGQAQLVPARGVDLTLLAPPPPPEPPVALHTLRASDSGRRVTVAGTVVEAAHFAAGFKFTLDDGSGRVRLVLFERAYDTLTPAQAETLNVGAVVTATGQIDAFADELQIVAGSGSDVQVGPGARDVKAYALGRLSGNDHNAVVQLHGTLESVQDAPNGGSKGLELLLKDDTGVQKIRLDRVVAERVMQRLKIAAGARLVVIGRVRASRSAGLRIDVALPADVTVDSVLKE